MNRVEDLVKIKRNKRLDPKQREKQLQILLRHPEIAKFRHEHPQISDQLYRTSMSRLNQVVQERENCNRCEGLVSCSNIMTGHVPHLVAYNDMIDLQLKPCHYYRSIEEHNRRSKLIRSHHIPKDILQASFDTIEPNGERISVIEDAIQFCTQLANGQNPKGLYLYGPLGVGKSHIAGAIMNQLVQYDIDSYMFYVPELMREINDSIQDNTLQSKLDVLKKASVLIFDDIGAEFLSPWKRDEVLGAILQYRAAEGLPTIYTSNLDLEELEEHLAQTQKGGNDKAKAKRILERITHYVTPYYIEGQNWRKKLSKKA
ncbi:primosomal protein DnaI [Hazenella sp. IB182357]|uniref:Primosomal protein DnaI n=1 Tax=Polycladospora coralii TaxID=2771432 RepID=A0A926NAA5_9BACL|nr:primosomal protein DnaI [Polycladospora coralii]